MLLLIIGHNRDKSDALDVEIDMKNGMVNFKRPRALVKKGKNYQY